MVVSALCSALSAAYTVTNTRTFSIVIACLNSAIGIALIALSFAAIYTNDAVSVWVIGGLIIGWFGLALTQFLFSIIAGTKSSVACDRDVDFPYLFNNLAVGSSMLGLMAFSWYGVSHIAIETELTSIFKSHYQSTGKEISRVDNARGHLNYILHNESKHAKAIGDCKTKVEEVVRALEICNTERGFHRGGKKHQTLINPVIVGNDADAGEDTHNNAGIIKQTEELIQATRKSYA